MQQAKPTNAKGVEVTLSAIDPNGNLVPIGTTTSDMNGNYAISFTPEVPGTTKSSLTSQAPKHMAHHQQQHT